ncbi:hypothetical protein ACLOJK_024832 [Asimina triloba]
MGPRHLSSQIGGKGSSDEDALEDFSEQDTPSDTDEAIDDVVSELAVADGELEDRTLATAHSERDFLVCKVGMDGDRDPEKSAACELLMVVLRARPSSVHTALDEWINKGNKVDQEEVMIALRTLRKHRDFLKAWKLIDWVEANNPLNRTEFDYAFHVDLIMKVKGLQHAETYIETRIPESLRGEIVYRTLLANCVIAGDCRNAERLFKKMRVLGFTLTTFSYNQLLVLYKRYDWKKFADLLMLMATENVKLDQFTYRLLIDIKGFANDIAGMELVLEFMKANGVEPNARIEAAVAWHYSCRGLFDKAEAILKKIEGGTVRVYTDLLRIYSSFGKVDEVGRIWNACEANPQLHEYLAALNAWGRLGDVERAEAVFEKIVEKWKHATSKHYLFLLNIYVDHKMFAKGMDFVKRTINDGICLGPSMWVALVKFYSECGELEKADAFLQKLALKNAPWQMHSSCIFLLNQYAARGDVPNAERMFDRLRRSAYVGTRTQYHLLLKAYINAKTPAYGLRERLKADGITPTNALAAMLAKVESFVREPS